MSSREPSGSDESRILDTGELPPPATRAAVSRILDTGEVPLVSKPADSILETGVPPPLDDDSPPTQGWQEPPTTPYVPASPLWPAIPGYEILDELGQGGMGVVYKAKQVQLQRLVALKMIKGKAAREDILQRFKDEAQSLARLQHPHIVQIFEIGDHDGMPYFAMEFCQGGSLDRHVHRKPLPPHESATLLETLALAMHAAHQAMVVHRDLKPANVLLTADSMPKITDFGLARKLDEQGLSESGIVVGTPAYMAPEQAEGRSKEIGPLADVWSLGCILYECLTGHVPFRGKTLFDTLELVIKQEPVPPLRLNALCPPDLETICLKCMQKRPEARYASARHLADDLRRYLDGKPIEARPAGRVERFAKWARRSPYQAATLAAGAALVLVTFVALVVLLQSFRKDAALKDRELLELQRLDDVRAGVTALYTKAEQQATKESWGDVEGAATEALNRLDTEPALADFPLREPVRKLQAEARRQLADARNRQAARDKQKRLQAHHGDAVFFASEFTGLEPAENLQRVRDAVRSGLSLFGVTLENTGPPQAEATFYAPHDVQRITEQCYELLLFEAEALARRRPGETDPQWHARLRQVLTRLDRADGLWDKDTRLRCGLRRRADTLEALGETDKAALVRQQADLTPPRLAADHFQAALDHYRQEEYPPALERLGVILRDQPEHYAAELLQAICRLRDRQHQPAYEGFTRCLKQRPDNVWPRLPRGIAAMELRRWDEARDDFEAVAKNPPDETAGYVALVNRGALGIYRQDWEQAVTDLRAALARKPDGTAAAINLVKALRQRAQGKEQQAQACREAVAVLDPVIARNPTEATLYEERAGLRLFLGDTGRARDDYLNAVTYAVARGVKTRLADNLIALGRLHYRDGQHDDAVRAYEAALEVQPDKAIARRLLVQPLLALKRYEQAGEALDRYLETVPTTPGKPPTAEQAGLLAEGRKVRGLIHDERAQAHRQRGVLHLVRDDVRAALDSYTHALTLVRDAETLTYRGWAYLMLNAAELALADFDEALKSKSDDANALVGRANALARLGKTTEAVQVVERALKGDVTQTRLLYNAARVHALAARPGNDSERRAVGLLGQAITGLPQAERGAFWKGYVEADPAFDAVRKSKGMSALAVRFGGRN